MLTVYSQPRNKEPASCTHVFVVDGVAFQVGCSVWTKQALRLHVVDDGDVITSYEDILEGTVLVVDKVNVDLGNQKAFIFLIPDGRRGRLLNHTNVGMDRFFTSDPDFFRKKMASVIAQ